LLSRPFLVTAAWAIYLHAMAAPIAVVNPGFEDILGESPFNEFTFGPLNGWGLYDPHSIAAGGAGNTYFIGTLTPFEPDPVNFPGVYANFPGGAAEGQRVAIAFNFFGSGNQGEYGYQQTLAATLQPLTQYSLEVEIGNIASAFARNGQFFDLRGFPGYRVELLTGGVVIAEDDNSLAGSIADGVFGTSTVTFTTGPIHPQFGQPLSIRLMNLNIIDPLFPGSDLEVDFDGVRLDASPAPGGDYNFDGVTDGADYVVWQKVTGSPEAYDMWRRNFAAAQGGGQTANSSTTPEPLGILSFALGMMAIRTTRRR
jgi:hapalindole H/12-epi-hapalindole U/12-epi-fischerindole U synthase